MLFHLSSLLAMSCSSSPSDSSVRDQIDGVELSWYGVTSLRIRFEDHVWLLDPFFSRPNGEALKPNQTGLELMKTLVGPKVDRVFVGHAHYDHILDAQQASEHYSAPVYGSSTSCLIVDSESCVSVEHGWTEHLDGVDITAIRTPHWRPSLSGIGTYETLDEPSEDFLSAPNGGVLSFHMSFPNGFSLLFQDSIGELDVEDGSGENYFANLETLKDKETELWVTCGDCLDTQNDFKAYLEVISPAQAIAVHWDGLMPDLTTAAAIPSLPAWKQALDDHQIHEIKFEQYSAPMIFR